VTDLSVIVVSWNTRELLLECLNALANTIRGLEGKLAAEVIVVDNGSSDGSAEAVAARHRDFGLLALAENRGFAGGCNAGLAKAKGRIALLLNSDAFIDAESVMACVEALDRDPAAGLAAPQLVRSDGRLQSSTYPMPGLRTELLPKALLEMLFPKRFPSKRWPMRETRAVEAVIGAVLFVKRAALESVGPLDEAYFFFLEETDWCWRMRERGWRVLFVPQSRALHISGASSKRVHPAVTRIEFHRSLYRFLARRRGRWVCLVAACLRLARAAGTLALALPAAPFSATERARVRERWALVRWHLAGCPPEPSLERISKITPVARAGTAR
jgi:GT2 family glycosyltransferase